MDIGRTSGKIFFPIAARETKARIMTTALQDIPLKAITGEATTLAAYQGKVLLVVNVASKCGLTPQYDALEKLYQQYRDQGVIVLGFPANDFAGQEPGTEAEIQQFCTTTFDVHFPMFAKIVATGDQKHPLYAALIAARPTARTKAGGDFRKVLEGHGIKPNAAPEVLWNFEKFLIDRAGRVVDRFAPDVAPDDPLIVGAIEKTLAG
jgi:glutathione peroxidase